MNCRHCKTPLVHTFLDLGVAPPSNAYLTEEDLDRPEVFFPLRVMVCDRCWLVQTQDYTAASDLFRSDYAYFSSTSTTWLEHAARYAKMIIDRLGLGRDSLVIEVASNDGYLLKNFVAAGIPCLGIEPTAGTAAAAEALGIPVRQEFFGESLGRELAAAGRRADLIAGNNVYAHVPDINDFTRGLAAALASTGTITLEFPHLLRLIAENQFDTVYHEHFSYLSLGAVARIFAAAELRVWDIEQLPTHGGSLRVYGCHAADPRPATPAVARIMEAERAAGLETLAPYIGFQACAERVKDDLLDFLIGEKRAGRKVAAYGAAAKGNTLLNFAGVKPDLLPLVADAAPAKQGRFLPGSRIPVVHPDALVPFRPETILILPWNLATEVRALPVVTRIAPVATVTAIPRLAVDR